ncbi:MAG: hypothetical protein DI536_09575 [Archangium gephyra]|uniref:Uncharacterized protein n=1 Tax=Archangium gephyra TaxID=48 RepID=A0A2W5TR47_9BACT|nr:MAG: hypothetical protein DI536_09575 [Archangium gephyra]
MNGDPASRHASSPGSEPAPAGAIGGFIALKTLDLDFASNSNVHTFGGGCFAQDWLVATPTYLTFQRYFEFTEDTTAPWASFNIDLWCYAGFVL